MARVVCPALRVLHRSRHRMFRFFSRAMARSSGGLSISLAVMSVEIQDDDHREGFRELGQRNTVGALRHAPVLQACDSPFGCGPDTIDHGVIGFLLLWSVPRLEFSGRADVGVGLVALVAQDAVRLADQFVQAADVAGVGVMVCSGDRHRPIALMWPMGVAASWMLKLAVDTGGDVDELFVDQSGYTLQVQRLFRFVRLVFSTPDFSGGSVAV